MLNLAERLSLSIVSTPALLLQLGYLHTGSLMRIVMKFVKRSKTCLILALLSHPSATGHPHLFPSPRKMVLYAYVLTTGKLMLYLKWMPTLCHVSMTSLINLVKRSSSQLLTSTEVISRCLWLIRIDTKQLFHLPWAFFSLGSCPLDCVEHQPRFNALYGPCS